MNKDLLDILVCPECKGAVELLSDQQDGIVCKNCELLFPIKDDIPIMLVDEATSLKDE